MASTAENEAIVREVAAEEGVDPNLAVAMAIQESGLNNLAIGDGGDSVGTFQLNIHGLGAGMSVAERQEPRTNARTALRHLRQTRDAHPELAGNPGALAAASQRPYDPAGYAASVNARLAALAADSGADSGWSPDDGNPSSPLLLPTAGTLALALAAGAAIAVVVILLRG